MADVQKEVGPCVDAESSLSEPDDSCRDFIMQQTMMRVKDPRKSLDFYSRVLGMRSVLRQRCLAGRRMKNNYLHACAVVQYRCVAKFGLIIILVYFIKSFAHPSYSLLQRHVITLNVLQCGAQQFYCVY